MKLYVDDRRIPPDGWHCARSVTEAIRILNSQHVEEISLDHDICHEKAGHAMGYEWEDGYKIACCENFSAVAIFLTHIIDLANYPMAVSIHTTNRDGALNMQNILGEVGIKASWSPALD